MHAADDSVQDNSLITRGYIASSTDGSKRALAQRGLAGLAPRYQKLNGPLLPTSYGSEQWKQSQSCNYSQIERFCAYGPASTIG